MAYLVKADLASHLYGANIDEITRNNDSLVTLAINTAVAESKSYLSKYDLSLLFADTPTPADENLKSKVKDIACWHLVTLANPNINIDMMRLRYEDAVKWFINIMKGQCDPADWPYPADDADTDVNEGGPITFFCNTQRRNQF